MRRSLASVLSLLLMGSAAAQESAPDAAAPAPAPTPAAEVPLTPAPPAAAPVLPSGPVTVTADRAEFQKGGVMIYSGNVQLDAEGLGLRGTRLELQQGEGGHYTARIGGTPAQLGHRGGLSATGAVLPEVSAQANSLIYDSASGIVEISGGAQLVRGSDRISGEMILYNVAERRIQATGGVGGQVKIVIQPPPPAEPKP